MLVEADVGELSVHVGDRIRVRRARPTVEIHVCGDSHLSDDLADDRHRAGQQASLLGECVEQNREEKIGRPRFREQPPCARGERNRWVRGDRPDVTLRTPSLS